jgi:flagellar biosynthetic protein FliR
MPGLPATPLALFVLLFGEITIGVFLGLIGRIMLVALHTTGTVISFQIGMANAFVFDAATSQQASLPSMFLTVLGVLIIFTANLHHLMLRAVVDSYTLFTPGVMPPIEDFSQFISRLVADSFILGIQLAGPFMAVGLIFYLGIGLLARLMPQVQIFFIALPMQIMFGILVVALTLSAALMWFLDSFEMSLIGAFSPV